MYVYVCVRMYVAIRRPRVHHACAMRKTSHQCLVTLNNAHQEINHGLQRNLQHSRRDHDLQQRGYKLPPEERSRLDRPKQNRESGMQEDDLIDAQ